MYESDQVTAYWDLPVYKYQTELRENRVDVRFVDRENKTVTLLVTKLPLGGEQKAEGGEDNKVRAVASGA